MAGAGLISCPACGSSYPWKPQLAGKKVRCKCGKLFAAVPPKALPAQPVAEPDVFALDEDLDVRAIPEPQNVVTSMPAAWQAPRKAATTIAPAAGGSGAPGMAAAYPTHGRRRVVAQEEDSAESKRKLIVPLAVLVLLLGGGIFAGLAMKGGMLAKNKPLLGDDAMIIEMIEDENGTEVKEWLKAHNRHMFMSMTEGQAAGFADRLYALGALKVLAFGEVISKSVAVELPDDPEKRKKLFEFERDHNGFRSKTKDVGQKYFLLWM
ncbi:MAG: zinc-ribbon domain-containing protein [Planctomycetota bacterium]|nr:zinc-ribbon domain-containing protein [Planctomycetota bacterium]